MTQLESCRKGHHVYKEIAIEDFSYDDQKVTEWCTFCGIIVQYMEYDNRRRNLTYETPKLLEELKL